MVTMIYMYFFRRIIGLYGNNDVYIFFQENSLVYMVKMMVYIFQDTSLVYMVTMMAYRTTILYQGMEYLLIAILL